jgi:protein tyrosine phosphatase (PTP) superfamily phosphohydrolase (DUF442 family)
MPMRKVRSLALGLVLLGSAWSQTPALPATRAAQLSPCDACVPGVINFAKVSETLWRGSQPTAEGFRNLEKLGVKTIVSFRHDHDDLPLLRGTNLKYLRIPSRAYHPTDAHLARFLRLMLDPANGPVFIHCAQGRDRTGYNAAAYRMVVQGWSAEEAIAEMKRFRFNRIWMGNPGYLRHLDVEAMKRQISGLPPVEAASAPH